MSYRYHKPSDRMIGHDHPGVIGHGFPDWELNEIELGARVAIALDDPEQWFWELYAPKQDEQEVNNDDRDSAPDDPFGGF